MELRVTRLADGHERTLCLWRDEVVRIGRTFVAHGRHPVLADLYISRRRAVQLQRRGPYIFLRNCHVNAVRVRRGYEGGGGVTTRLRHRRETRLVSGSTVRFCTVDGAAGVECTDVLFEVMNDDDETQPPSDGHEDDDLLFTAM